MAGQTRLTIRTCVERQLPDGTWAPEQCYAEAINFRDIITPDDTLKCGHAAQRAADEIRRNWNTAHTEA